MTDTKLPCCPICEAPLGWHHLSTCKHSGQILPSEIPGFIEYVAIEVLKKEKSMSAEQTEIEALKKEVAFASTERKRLADELFDLRNKAGCGPEQPGPDIWERFASLQKENDKLQLRVKGALELAADLVAQRDEFIAMKKTYDSLVKECESLRVRVAKQELDVPNMQTHINQLKATIFTLKQDVEDMRTARNIAQNRYAPMLKENEHHRRERDVLETQLILIRDKAISYVAKLPPFSEDAAEEAAIRSDISRELFAMATPRKS